MLFNLKYKNYFQTLTLIIAAFIISFLTANSVGQYKERNDIEAYANYFSCLSSNKLSIIECNHFIGKPYDFLYQNFVYYAKFFLGINSFYIFIFLFSFYVYISIFYFVNKTSPIFIVGFLFLITDFRFWEYGSNTLRFGLSVAIFMPIFYLFIKKPLFSTWMSFLAIIPSFAHTVSIVFILARFKKQSIFLILVSLFLAVVFIFNFDYFFNNIASLVLPKSVFDKIDYYNRLMENTEYSYRVPLHYAAIIFIGLIFLWKNYIDDPTYIYSFNIVWTILLFTIVVYPIGMSHRLFSLMLPFLAIMLSYQISFILKYNSLYIYKISVILYLILVFSFIFYKNFEFIIRGI